MWSELSILTVDRCVLYKLGILLHTYTDTCTRHKQKQNDSFSPSHARMPHTHTHTHAHTHTHTHTFGNLHIPAVSGQSGVDLPDELHVVEQRVEAVEVGAAYM